MGVNAKVLPKPDLDRIIRRLVVALETDTVNPFEMNGFKNSARRMRISDPEMAFCILGIIAAIEHDVQEMRSCFRNAMLHAPGSWEIRYIYANTLLILGFYSESVQISRETCHRFPGHAIVYNSIIQASYRAGRMAESKKWIGEWEQARKDVGYGFRAECGHMDDQGNHSLLANVNRLLEFYRKHALTDDDVESMQRLAVGVLHENDYYPYEIRMSLIHEGAEDHLLCEMILADVLPEVMAVMEQEMARRRQAANLSSHLLKSVIYGYTLCNLS